MKSELPHYFINDMLFILYMDAYDYCLTNNISTDLIKKSYEY